MLPTHILILFSFATFYLRYSVRRIRETRSDCQLMLGDLL